LRVAFRSNFSWVKITCQFSDRSSQFLAPSSLQQWYGIHYSAWSEFFQLPIQLAKEIMRIGMTILLLCCGFAGLASAEAQTPLPLMPMPAHVTGESPAAGRLLIDSSFSVAITGHTDTRIQNAVERFLDHLRRRTGMLPLDMRMVQSEPASLVVHTDHAGNEVPQLGEDESYSLEVTTAGAKLNAATTLGTLHGLQTFLQLVEETAAGFAVPAISIQDAPRFPWRGLMIDSGRHFMPLDLVKRELDGMEAVKLNVLHWHLSENQGFRVESKKFPKLQEMGSDGLYYTQEEIRGLIAYAADRGIRVVPEFDMPGHSTAWFVGYPELASAPGPYQIERKWGVFDPAMDPTRESTYKFLDAFIGEMAKLFPDQYFHIGGDEVNGKQWGANPKIQEFMRAHNIKSNDELQAHFNQRIQKIVSGHGKTMMGWDEILQPDLPKSIVIQSWRGQDSLAQAAKQGYSGLLSAGYYLDLNWPTWRHYAVDPMSGAAANLSDEEKKRILGGEACMWAEFVSPENVDSRIWPRAAAVAERLWSPQDVTDVDSMYQRMGEVSRQLDWLGLTHNSNYLPMLRRIAGRDDVAALRALADVVEPVKDYERGDSLTIQATSLMPLNRLVDAARPESIAARQFAELVDEFVARKIKPGTEAEIRATLIRWRDNETDLQPMAEGSFLLQDVPPLSHDLSTLGTAGLQALDYLDHGQAAPEEWRAQQIAFLEQAKKPRAQVELMVVLPVEKLIEASAAQTAK
jgi:hexosaminidase